MLNKLNLGVISLAVLVQYYRPRSIWMDVFGCIIRWSTFLTRPTGPAKCSWGILGSCVLTGSV